MKTLFAAMLVIGLLGCEALPKNTASSSADVHAGNIYQVCLPIETKASMERKEASPEIVAHYICSFFKGTCKDEPNGESCQKGIREYSAKLK
jgi:hypothetical protein